MCGLCVASELASWVEPAKRLHLQSLFHCLQKFAPVMIHTVMIGTVMIHKVMIHTVMIHTVMIHKVMIHTVMIHTVMIRTVMIHTVMIHTVMIQTACVSHSDCATATIGLDLDGVQWSKIYAIRVFFCCICICRAVLIIYFQRNCVDLVSLRVFLPVLYLAL